ncbi:MAG: response regulator transcription factor [Bacteroidia bacterium]|nr:response regulator transcription factor [Bacteroidia bacterium]
MIKAVIIDDEQNCVEMLEWLLKTYCPMVQIAAMCNSGEQGIEAIMKHRPDVVFLDIEMPRMNGFDMLEKFEHLFFDVVFTTAYNKFAIKAFRYSALNYLLKPVDPDDLQSTIKKLEEKRSAIEKDQLRLLLDNMKNLSPTTQRIALSTGDGLIFVNTADIMYCQAESNYTNVVMSNRNKVLVAKTLKDIDETLSGKDFFRIHNSFLINMNHIKKFVRGDGGYILMNDDTQITIARSKREEFFEMFSKF